MAAAVCKQRGTRRTSIILEESLSLVANFSDNAKIDRKIKFDLILGTLLNGVSHLKHGILLLWSDVEKQLSFYRQHKSTHNFD
jgi:hypothetical protein